MSCWCVFGLSAERNIFGDTQIDSWQIFGEEMMGKTLRPMVKYNSCTSRQDSRGLLQLTVVCHLYVSAELAHVLYKTLMVRRWLSIR